MSNVKVEKQEPQGPSSPGAFEEWYDTKFKHGFERGPNDKYVARKAWFAALYTAPQPCPECEERKTTALNYISLTFEFEQLQSKSEKLKALSVTNILIDVVPGDGSGLEIYAKSVSDVEALLSRLGEKAEDYDLLKPKYEKLKAERDELAETLCRGETYNYGVRVGSEHSDALRKERDELAAQVEKMREKILEATIGSCSCLTKTDDPKHHVRLCSYRRLMEILDLPDLSTGILNRVRADAVRKASYSLEVQMDRATAQQLRALAADMEAGKC